MVRHSGRNVRICASGSKKHAERWYFRVAVKANYREADESHRGIESASRPAHMLLVAPISREEHLRTFQPRVDGDRKGKLNTHHNAGQNIRWRYEVLRCNSIEAQALVQNLGGNYRRA